MKDELDSGGNALPDSDGPIAIFSAILRILRQSGGVVTVSDLKAQIGSKRSVGGIIAEMVSEGILVTEGDAVRLRQDLGQAPRALSSRDSTHLKD